MRNFLDSFKSFMSVRKHIVWLIVISAVVILGCIGFLEIHRVFYEPQTLFNFDNPKPSTKPTPIPSHQPGAVIIENSLAPVNTPSSAPTSIQTGKGILNILLIGISAGSGVDPHADGIMVMAINFNENKVDLISLPRDTFIYDSDIMKGVYKLNASFNVGGGYSAKNGEGFVKVCQAAEYMLGGIPINYYYAVNFDSVVNLVNTIGGVDYNVEDPAYSLKGVGGMQHMDGADVLYYMRVRKVGPEKGDKSRVNRQKQMLIAVFNQLKKNGKLSMIPDFLKTVDSSFYTNISLEQTLALIKFASSMNTDTIGAHSMTGTLLDRVGWAFCFTDQEARKELIKQIYGVDVPEQVHSSPDFATWLTDYGFSGIRYLETAKQVLDYANNHKVDLGDNEQKAYNQLVNIYNTTQATYERTSLSLSKNDDFELANDEKELRSASENLANLIKYSEKLVWTYNPQYWNDPAINEVKVDFR